MKRIWPWAFAAVAFAAYGWLGLGFIRSAAATYDEPVHLASGYAGLKTGRFINALDHPLFGELWSALGARSLRPHLFLQHPDWAGARVYHYGNLFLYKNRVPPDRLLNAARAFSLASLGLVLAAALGAWAWRLAGPAAAAAAVLGMALCPALLSNLAIVGTDGASAVLFFAACALAAEASRREDEGGKAFRVWAAAGAVVGLALASKFNMIALPPLLFALGAAGPLSAKPRRSPPLGLWAMLAAAATLLVIVYRFRLELWWAGLTATLQRLDEGRSSFFFGRHSTTGSWAYFPVALAIKSPLATLAFAAMGLLSLARLPWRRSLWVWAPPALYLAAALTSKVQIGYRHVLPVVPFLVLWAGLGAAALLERGLAGRAASAALGLWLAATVARVHPHHLAYFNELVGGPAQGHRYLVDSNLDWGQALKLLGDELRRLGGLPVYLAYFGTADPEAYGIRYMPLGMIDNLERTGNDPDPAASGRVLFAISATNYQATYYKDKDAFAWLRDKTPLAVLGYSLFLYDFTADPSARRRLADFIHPASRKNLVGRGI
ncbi:MAG: hypothetical protein HY553_09930 [Elusimicrobia bacterium]|nr:hypothetical protein [Elusimicrobiota bacterium]